MGRCQLRNKGVYGPVWVTSCPSAWTSRGPLTLRNQTFGSLRLRAILDFASAEPLRAAYGKSFVMTAYGTATSCSRAYCNPLIN
jgi:hypothetical protein